MKALFLPILLCTTVADAAIPEIPFTQYSYSQYSCAMITHTSGSQVFIPENAFLPACDGNITIRYRVFHSQADMVVGNIPMDFFQGKSEHTLESGGMFEIYADCDGTELKLAQGKKIQVRFATRNPLEGMNAFFFDKTKGWQMLPDPVIDMAYDPANKYDASLWGDGPPSLNIGDQPVEGEWNDSEWLTMDGDSYYQVVTEKKPPVMFMGMDIAQMGLFNYDRILNEETSVPFVVDFRIKGEKKSLDSRIYVTYSGLNTVVNYTPEEWREKFSLLPRKDIRIFCMLKDGRVAVLMPTDIDKLDIGNLRNKKHTFELVIGDVKPETKEQLASVAGIQP